MVIRFEHAATGRSVTRDSGRTACTVLPKPFHDNKSGPFFCKTIRFSIIGRQARRPSGPPYFVL